MREKKRMIEQSKENDYAAVLWKSVNQRVREGNCDPNWRDRRKHCVRRDLYFKWELFLIDTVTVVSVISSP
jgi:hypothetical protein